jgi:hypothetical protein
LLKALEEELQGKRCSKKLLAACAPAPTEKDVLFFDKERVFEGQNTTEERGEREEKKEENKEEKKEEKKESAVRPVVDEERDFDDDLDDAEHEEHEIDVEDD